MWVSVSVIWKFVFVMLLSSLNEASFMFPSDLSDYLSPRLSSEWLLSSDCFQFFTPVKMLRHSYSTIYILFVFFFFLPVATWSVSRWWKSKSCVHGAGRSSKVSTSCTQEPRPLFTGTSNVTTSSSRDPQAQWRLVTWAWPHWRGPPLPRVS